MTPFEFNPPPVYIDIFLKERKFLFFKKVIKERFTLLPFTLEVEAWANQEFATNETQDNGLEILSERLGNIHDDAIFHVVQYLLEDKTCFDSPEKLMIYWKLLGVSKDHLFKAIEKVLRNSQPFLEAQKAGGAKKKDL